MMTRLVIALGMIMVFEFGYIYIIPPTTHRRTRHVYRKLLSLAYGICDAGRKWVKTSYSWITKELRMDRLAGAHQLFAKRDHKDKLVLIVSNTTDDFLISRYKM